MASKRSSKKIDMFPVLMQALMMGVLAVLAVVGYAAVAYEGNEHEANVRPIRPATELEIQDWQAEQLRWNLEHQE